MRIPRRAKIACGCLLWAGAVAAGFAAMARYSAQPGRAKAPAPSAAWALFARYGASERPLLVMAVHPRCPCTSASLDEMADLLAKAQGACDGLILSYQAPGWPVEAEFRRMGGYSVRSVSDPSGLLAGQLGALTSGHCILIDQRGAVRFYGGITPGRGHRGEAAGQKVILSALRGGSPGTVAAPVYGCSLTPDRTGPSSL